MRNRNDVPPSGWVVFVCALLFMLAAIWLYNKNEDCAKRGGVLVRGITYECVMLQRVPEKKP